MIKTKAIAGKWELTLWLSSLPKLNMPVTIDAGVAEGEWVVISAAKVGDEAVIVLERQSA